MAIRAALRVDVVTSIAPSALWSRIAEVYVAAFSAPPYEEDPSELGEILRWGPEFLRSPGGRLVAASEGDAVIAFALGRPLSVDPGYQGLLARCGTAEADAIITAPEKAFIVQELATSAQARRRGIGAECLSRLARDSGALTTVLGVYAHAEDARAFYRRLGFGVVGTVTLNSRHDLLIHAR